MSSDDSQSQFEEEDVLEDGEDQGSDEEAHNSPKQSKRAKKRGPRPIPKQWSRVLLVDESCGDHRQVWNLTEDIEKEKNAEPKKKRKQNAEWEPLFISEGFFEPNDKPQLDDYVLKDRKLRWLGQKVTLLRQSLTEAAYKHEDRAGSVEA